MNPSWPVSTAGLLVGVVAGLAALRLRRTAPSGLVSVLVAGWWLVVAVGVPETDHLIELGVLLGVLVAVAVFGGQRLPAIVDLAAIGAVVWAGLYGSVGQTRPIIVSLASATVLVVPALLSTARRATRDRSARRIVVISALTLFAALALTRLTVHVTW